MPTSKSSANDAAKTVEASVTQVQKVVDEANEQGFYGTTADPTPRENYTVAGVTSGAPTPETNDDAADEARKARSGS